MRSHEAVYLAVALCALFLAASCATRASRGPAGDDTKPRSQAHVQWAFVAEFAEFDDELHRAIVDDVLRANGILGHVPYEGWQGRWQVFVTEPNGARARRLIQDFAVKHQVRIRNEITVVSS